MSVAICWGFCSFDFFCDCPLYAGIAGQHLGQNFGSFAHFEGPIYPRCCYLLLLVCLLIHITNDFLHRKIVHANTQLTQNSTSPHVQKKIVKTRWEENCDTSISFNRLRTFQWTSQTKMQKQSSNQSENIERSIKFRKLFSVKCKSFPNSQNG